MSGRRKKILYIQHAGALGGSAVSLKYLVGSLDRERFEPVIALIRPNADLVRFYSGLDVQLIHSEGIVTFEHTALLWTHPFKVDTWPHLAVALARWSRTERLTRELVRTVCPDIVHLNSAVLLPSARALHSGGVPFVWHVREGASHGIAGVRLRLMREAMLRWPAELVFLTEAERTEWVGGTRGRVIRNVVDLDRFDPTLDRNAERRTLGIPLDAKVLLYVGGLAEIKGVLPLLEALELLRARDPKIICLMPGATLLDRHAGGSTTFNNRLRRALEHCGDSCIQTGFRPDVERLLAAADMLVFPALSNHFARPIVEAGAMERPVVASDFPITREQVRDELSGVLVPHGNRVALADAIARILRDPIMAARMGRAGRAMAMRDHDVRRNTTQMMDMYDELLKRVGARRQMRRRSDA